MLTVFAGFLAKGAIDLVAESWLLPGATDISLLRTLLVIPQGLWAFGLGMFFCSPPCWSSKACCFSSPGAAVQWNGSFSRAATTRKLPRRWPRFGRPKLRPRRSATHDHHRLLRCSLPCWSAWPCSAATWGVSRSARFSALIGLFVLFFGSGVYIGAALGVLGLIAGFAFSDRPFWLYIGQTIRNPSSSFILVAVPLFLLMGVLLRAGLSDRLYRALNLWLNRLPGGLLHTNVVSSGVFSAISGSSVATAATMGSVALPFFRGTAYDRRYVGPRGGARWATSSRPASRSSSTGSLRKPWSVPSMSQPSGRACSCCSRSSPSSCCMACGIR